MKSNQIFSKTMAAVAIALPALGILALTGCTSDETIETPANESRTVTFTAVAPEGAGSRALWDDATSGKLGFEWEAETDTKIDLYWTGAAQPMQRDATLGGHSGASVTVTGTAPEGATEVVALFPANTIQVGDGEMYRTLPTELTQVGAGTAHLRDYMYLNGTLAVDKVTEGAATMQLAHGCAVLRFNVSNGGETAVRVTRVEMLAASGKTGVNTRAAITAGNVEDGISYSEPQNIAVAVQNALDDTKGYELVSGVGELAVYAHCFPTAIEDGQFQFLVTVTDDKGENEKTYITKEAFSASGITTTDDTYTAQKMFKAGYYYTFNLDIANTTRFEELQDYTTQTDEGGNVTGYIVNTYAGLQAWRAAVMNEGGTMKDEDLNLTLGMDIILPAVAEDGNNWTPVGGAYVNSTYQTYKGIIDGGGHTISGLVINSSNLGGNGFIGRMQGGSITNLKLADVRVTGSSSTGALVGDATNTHISDCEVTGTVSGSGSMGGLIGMQSNGSITRCINRAAVTTTGQYAGGIVGSAYYLTISGCKNYGSVAASTTGGYAGGMSGEVSMLTITNCTNYAASITGLYAGYLVGYVDNSCSSDSSNENQSGNSDLKEYGFFYDYDL